MNNKNPFIKRCQTDKNFYIYDVNTNRILLVDEIIYQIIPLLNKCSNNEILAKLKDYFPKKLIEENIKKIKVVQPKYNLFSSKRPSFRGFGSNLSVDFIKEKINDEGIRQLSLEATQQCNLRCKYCAYSGIYSFNRIHNPSHMSFSVAKKAINFYFHRTKGSGGCVSFYGGEPLLRLDLIKKSVEYLNYLKSKNGKEDISIRISTNGTLMHKDLIDYFIKNKITIQVSLDGPRKFHDKYRIDKNKKGSFSRVIANLKEIYKKNPNYYKKFIIFICVITPSTNIIELIDFFTSNPLTKDNYQLHTFVNKKNSIYFDTCDYKNLLNYQKEELKYLYRKFLSKLIVNSTNKSHFFKNIFEKSFVEIHKRKIINKPGDNIPFQGPCLPGTRKLYISTDGKFHICERINSHFPIGDVENGYNFQRINEIMNEFNKIINEKDCLECWAMHFCSFCFVSVAKNGFMELDNKEEYCQKTKTNAMETLKDYACLLEENPELAVKWDNVSIMQSK